MKPLALSNEVCGQLGITPSLDLPQQPGQICLANDSLIGQTTYTEELTSYGIGYGSPDRNKLTQLRDFLMPTRPWGTSRSAILTVYDENEPYETVDYTRIKRAPLADFAEVKQRSCTRTTKTIHNRGLTIRLDRDQLKEKPNWQQMHTAYLIDLLIRASVLEGIALYAASATADTLTWDNASNPDLQLKQRRLDIADVTGFGPNRAIYGDAAELKRQAAYEAQNTAGGFARAGLLTAEQIATAIGVDRVLLNAERYRSGAATKANYIGSKVLLYTAADQESPEDASNLVRHVANASYGSGEYAVYVTEQGVKTIFVTVENYELLSAQHTSGIELLTIQ